MIDAMDDTRLLPTAPPAAYCMNDRLFMRRVADFSPGVVTGGRHNSLKSLDPRKKNAWISFPLSLVFLPMALVFLHLGLDFLHLDLDFLHLDLENLPASLETFP